MMARPDIRALNERIVEGDAEGVLDELKEAVLSEPGQVACFVLLARSLEKLDRPLEALQSWRSAYLLCPESPVVKDELRRLAAEIAGRSAGHVRASRAAMASEAPAYEDSPDNHLDELIRELETARIVPDPTIKPVSADQLEPDVGDVVSETLAKIYANQRFFEEAAEVYEKLSEQQPKRRDEFLAKAEEVRKAPPK